MRGKEVLLTVLLGLHTVWPPTVPGPDTWDRSTCPWESFSGEGLSSPDDTHGNTCHTSATGHFSCKRCKSPHGCHPRKLRGRVREGTKRQNVNVNMRILGDYKGFRSMSYAPSNMWQEYSRNIGIPVPQAPTCLIQLSFPGQGQCS